MKSSPPESKSIQLGVMVVRKVPVYSRADAQWKSAPKLKKGGWAW